MRAVLALFSIFSLTAFSANPGPETTDVAIRCVATSTQGYSDEAAAKQNPNFSTGKIELVRQKGTQLVSKATFDLRILDETGKYKDKNPGSLSYFGKHAKKVEIGSGIFLHLMVWTDDVKKSTDGAEAWENTSIFAEMYRKYPDGHIQVLTAGAQERDDKFWAKGAKYKVALPSTEGRTAFYNMPSGDDFSDHAALIKNGYAVEGFLQGAYVECERIK